MITSSSFHFKTNKSHEQFSLSGFDYYEDWGVWSFAEAVEISLDSVFINLKNIKSLSLRFRPYISVILKYSIIEIRTSWGEELILRPNTNEILDVCIDVIPASSHIIFIKIPTATSPEKDGISTDNRKLGIGLLEIIFNVDKKNDVDKQKNISDIQNRVLASVNSAAELLAYTSNLLGNKEIIADCLSGVLLNDLKKLSEIEIRALIKTMLLCKGFTSQASMALEEILLSVIKNDVDQCDNVIGVPQSISPQNIICIGGFYYSGSSAVYDFLRDFENCVTPAPYDVEIRLIKFYYENYILKKCESILPFVLEFLIECFPDVNFNNYDSVRSKEFSFFARVKNGDSRISIDEYSKYVTEFIRDLIINNNESRLGFTNFVANCSGLKGFNANSMLLLNQCPSAMEVYQLEAFADCVKYVAVTRDPRDQYVDQMVAGAKEKGVYSDVSGFINKYRSDRSAYQKFKSNNIKNYYFFDVKFEEFVMHDHYRLGLAERLGLNAKYFPKFFNPSNSELNIGIYKKWINISEIVQIERELQEYLVN